MRILESVGIAASLGHAPGWEVRGARGAPQAYAGFESGRVDGEKWAWTEAGGRSAREEFVDPSVADHLEARLSRHLGAPTPGMGALEVGAVRASPVDERIEAQRLEVLRLEAQILSQRVEFREQLDGMAWRIRDKDKNAPGAEEKHGRAVVHGAEVNGLSQDDEPRGDDPHLQTDKLRDMRSHEHVRGRDDEAGPRPPGEGIMRGLDDDTPSSSGESASRKDAQRRDTHLAEMKHLVLDLRNQLEAAEKMIKESKAGRTDAENRANAIHEEKRKLHSRLRRATQKAYSASPGANKAQPDKSPHHQHEIHAKIELRAAHEKLSEQANELAELRQVLATLRASPAISSNQFDELRRQRDELAAELANEREASLERLQRHQRMKVEALAALQTTHAHELAILRKEHKEELDKRRIKHERELRAALRKSDGTVPPATQRNTHLSPTVYARDLESSLEKVRGTDSASRVGVHGSASRQGTPSTTRGSPPRMGPLDEFLVNNSTSASAILDGNTASPEPTREAGEPAREERHEVTHGQESTIRREEFGTEAWETEISGSLERGLDSEGQLSARRDTAKKYVTPTSAREARKKELTSHLALLKKKRPGMV